jgi:hypothetical protein
MNVKSVVSLSTGLEDAEKVTVAFLVAVGSAESQRPTLMFLTKEAARLVVDDVARATACEGCPPLEDLVRRGRWSLPGLPDLLRRQAPGQGRPAVQRRARGHGPDVGVDRG